MQTINFNIVCKPTNKLVDMLENEGTKEMIVIGEYECEEVQEGKTKVDCGSLVELDTQESILNQMGIGAKVKNLRSTNPKK